MKVSIKPSCGHYLVMVDGICRKQFSNKSEAQAYIDACMA